jgi:hypothetical protein
MTEAQQESKRPLERRVRHRVVRMGWHCFSHHCKHATPDYRCTDDMNEDGRCRQEHCPVFRMRKMPNALAFTCGARSALSGATPC